MAYLEIRGQRHPIGIGEMAIGCDAANEVELGGGELHSKSAILQGMPDGQVVVKRADADSEVQINGIRLGPQPTPLLHGDKIEVAGQELLFVDDRRSGSTEYIKAVDPSMLGDSSKSKSKGAATAGTGGRLVSLTDGREYGITGGSVLIGRDASCDIVISAKNVSRRHAEVVATPRGYVLIDNSTNGTLVNGERVQGQHVLSRADVFRCGDHEFRFYADAAEVAAAPKQAAPAVVQAPPQPEQAPSMAPPAPRPSPPSAQSAPPSTPAKGAEQRLAHTMHGIPAMPRPGQPPKKPSPPPVKPTPPPASSGGSPLNPVPTPAKGAEQRLQHTMHGIPAMRRPGQPPKAPTPPKGAEQRLKDTMHGIPTDIAAQNPVPTGHSGEAPPTTPPVVELMPPPAAPAKPRTSSGAAPKSLASLLVRSGALKGHRVHVKVPIVNIGRAEYNDIVLPDDSVSTVHAKLQRREGIWVLVDLDSTNGTIVDGEPVDGEAPLAPGAIVRFGTIQTIFEPTDDSVESQQGGGTQVLQPVKLSPPDGKGHSGSPGSGLKPDGPPPHASMSGGPVRARPPCRLSYRTRRSAPARKVSKKRRSSSADGRLAILLLLLTSDGIR